MKSLASFAGHPPRFSLIAHSMNLCTVVSWQCKLLWCFLAWYQHKCRSTVHVQQSCCSSRKLQQSSWLSGRWWWGVGIYAQDCLIFEQCLKVVCKKGGRIFGSLQYVKTACPGLIPRTLEVCNFLYASNFRCLLSMLLVCDYIARQILHA